MTDARAISGRVLTALNFPSDALRTVQARMAAPMRQNAQVQVEQARQAASVRQIADVRAMQAHVLVAARGRVANPTLRVWTFTLDGHDFFVVRLGDDTTLLYDTATEQWIEWDSENSGAWRPNTGWTWVGGQSLGDVFGSNVVAGDDTFGLLWILDPRQGYDDAPELDRGIQQYAFERIVSGQVLSKGRENLPCYVVFLDGDNYGLTDTIFPPTVTLETSDDQGRTFDRHDTLNIQTDYAWYSLGQISSPGRIFRIRDTGVFARIDSMGVNDAG